MGDTTCRTCGGAASGTGTSCASHAAAIAVGVESGDFLGGSIAGTMSASDGFIRLFNRSERIEGGIAVQTDIFVNWHTILLRHQSFTNNSIFLIDVGQ